MENTEAVSLLIHKGVDVNSRDSLGTGALERARTRPMAELLLNLGVSTVVAAYCLGIGRLMTVRDNELRDLYFSSEGPGWMGSNAGTDALLASYSSAAKRLTFIDDTPFSKNEVRQILEQGCDVTVLDGTGKSTLHHFISDEEHAAYMLQNHLELVQRATAFPWHLLWNHPAFLESKFHHYRRLLPASDFRRILNLEPATGWSPLCWAVLGDMNRRLEDLLDLGAKIDFDGSYWGPALFLSVAIGRTSSARILLHRGALMSHCPEASARMSVFDLRIEDEMRKWLLSGRFMEQHRIGPGQRMDCRDGLQDDSLGFAEKSFVVPRPWSGVMQTRKRLVEKLQRKWGESTLDHVQRLAEWSTLR